MGELVSIDDAPSVASVRTLGHGSQQAAPGSDIPALQAAIAALQAVHVPVVYEQHGAPSAPHPGDVWIVT